jgi:hypothetical protein
LIPCDFDPFGLPRSKPQRIRFFAERRVDLPDSGLKKCKIRQPAERSDFRNVLGIASVAFEKIAAKHSIRIAHGRAAVAGTSSVCILLITCALSSLGSGPPVPAITTSDFVFALLPAAA